MSSFATSDPITAGLITEAPSITLPRPPAVAPPYVFPLAATLAPVLGSGVIWLVTASPFALVFAFLGPLIAVASLADSTWQGRGLRRAEAKRFESDVAATYEQIGVEHAAERSRRTDAHPGSARVLRGPAVDIDRWTAEPHAPISLVIGHGVVRSTLAVVEGHAPAVGQDPTVVARLADLSQVARSLTDAPVVIDAALGIGIWGPRSLSRAVARALVVQLARSISPAHTIIRVGDPAEWSWLAAMPHRREEFGRDALPQPPRGQPGPVERVEFEFGSTAALASGVESGGVLIAVADTVEDLPRLCRIVMAVGHGHLARVSERRSGLADRLVRPEYAAVEDALAYGHRLAACARAEGLARGDGDLPDLVRLASLDGARSPGRDDGEGQESTGEAEQGLRCAIGRVASSPWWVDLVADGPHAVVGGTTGSGKSELLLSWVLAMATRYPPSRVNFLLVDFKGGASFLGLERLPHSVGLITDLDPRAAKRALDSLAAEMRFRERTLASAGVRSVDELIRDGFPAQLPRLVILVDEFAALSRDFPELHILFVDLASRGRSLGVHLVLCTQRPAEAVRDAILANCPLRISLRVNDRADSTALVGSTAAASLPRHPRGRAIARVSGEPARPVQVALASVDDIARIASLWPGDPPARRPWCAPLPSMIEHGRWERPPRGIDFARADLPDEQRQETAVYEPHYDGNLLVVGASRTGKTTAIAAIAAGASSCAVRLIPTDIEGAWDDISELASATSRREGDTGTGTGTGTTLLLLDDLDSLVAGFGHDYQAEFLEMLARVLRDGPRQGIHSVIAAQRVTSALTSSAALCDSRLLLRLPNRQDHVVAGGTADQHDPQMPPGRGFWRDHLVQVGFVPPHPATTSRATAMIDFPAGASTAIVSSRPRDIAARIVSTTAAADSASPIRIVDLAERVGTDSELIVTDSATHTIIVGDPDSWQSSWTLFGAVRRVMPVMFDGCGIGEFRALTRNRALPPPLATSPPGGASRNAWLLVPDGTLRRAAV